MDNVTSIADLSRQAKRDAMDAGLAAGVLPNTGALYCATKRLIDLTVAVAGCILLVPMILCAAVGMKLAAPHAPLFEVTERGGRYNRPIRCIRFRRATVNGSLQTDAKRTAISAKTEALLQGVNILLGQMTLVGPEPFSVAEERALNGIYKARKQVKPGVIHPWHASDQRTMLPKQKLDMDLEYIRQQGLSTDLRLIARVIKAQILP